MGCVSSWLRLWMLAVISSLSAVTMTPSPFRCPLARQPTNGIPVKFSCAKHDTQVTVYGSPSATAWCHCGKEMKNPSKSISMRRPVRRG